MVSGGGAKLGGGGGWLARLRGRCRQLLGCPAGGAAADGGAARGFSWAGAVLGAAGPAGGPSTPAGWGGGGSGQGRKTTALLPTAAVPMLFPTPRGRYALSRILSQERLVWGLGKVPAYIAFVGLSILYYGDGLPF